MESLDNRFTSQVDFNSITETMGFGPFGASAPLFLRNGELLANSPIHNLHFDSSSPVVPQANEPHANICMLYTA
jgi:hypothetical protein